MSVTEQDMANVGPRDLKDEGSPAWCWQTVSLLQYRWTSLDLICDRYREVWEKATELRIWEKIPVDEPYGSLEVMKEKLQVGDAAEARVRVIDLAVKARPLRKQGGVNKYNKDALVTPQVHHGPATQAEYLTARVRRPVNRL